MRKIFKHWSIFIVFILLAVNGQAQSDVTNLILTNAGFDEQWNFTVNDDPVNLGSANGGANIKQVYGWKIVSIGDNSAAASFQYGYTGWLNSMDVTDRGIVPTEGYNSSTGGALGISSAWSATNAYGQDVTLPAGSYALEYAAFNSGPTDVDNSQVGWVPVTGDPVLSSKTAFTISSWDLETIPFELATNAEGSIQIGINAPGTGSANVGRIFFDYIKVTCYNIDKSRLQELISEGNTLYGNGSGTKAQELKAALDAVNAALNQEATSPTLINAAVSLGYALSEYKTQVVNEAFFAEKSAELETLLTEAETLISNHNANSYPQSALTALETAYTTAANAYDEGTLTFENIANYVDNLQLAVNAYKASSLGLKIRYTFDNVNGNTVINAAGDAEYNGTLYNEASVISMGKYKVLSLGNGTGYLDIGSQAGYIFPTASNYTISAYYRVDKNASLTGNGYFLWIFSSQEVNSATTGQYLFYQLNGQRFGITSAGWDNDYNILIEGGEAPKDEWYHVLYRQTGKYGELYVNGLLAAMSENEILSPTEFTATTLYNWIGRPPFNGDSYLKNTLVYDFRLYNQAVTDMQIEEWANLVPDLEKEYDYGTKGDFSQLTALIAEYNTFLSSISIGSNVGEYEEQAVLDLQVAIAAAQALVTDDKASQFLIDAQIAELKAAYTALLATVVPETNTFEGNGEYYIKVNNSLYLNNPGTSALANAVNLTVANSGLKANINIVNESQIYHIDKITVDETDPELFRYTIASAVNEADSIDDPYPGRWLNDWVQYGKRAVHPDWWSFDISHNQTVDAYAIYCGGLATARGYWRYIEAEQRLGNQDGITAVPQYIFNLIPVYTVFGEEVAKGRTVFNAAAVGTADNEYSQSVYDAFKTALETAETVTSETFTNDDLFAYGEARRLFVKNDGSNEFGDGTAIVEVKPTQSDVSITGGDKRIRIASDKAAKATVYSLTGATVAQKALPSGESFIPVNPGLYIVRVSGDLTTVKKIIVR